MVFVSPAKHGRHLGITFFFCPASVRPSVCHTFSSHFFVTLSNNFFSTRRIGLKLHTNVYINMCDGYTKGGIIQKNCIGVIAPFFCRKLTYIMLTFDLEMIGLSYFTMCIACDHTFPNLVFFLTSWPWPPSLTYLMLTFDSEVIGISYFTRALPMTTPFCI